MIVLDSIINIIFVFSLFVIFSFVLGKGFNTVLKKDFPEITIGFFVSLAISQVILMYPLLRARSTDWLYIPMIIILFFFIASVLLHLLKRNFFFNWKKALFVLLSFCLAAIIIVLFEEFESVPSDKHFYLGQILENTNADFLNSFDAFSGKSAHVPFPYRYQSYYFLLSGICKVFDVEPLMMAIWIVPLFLTVCKAETLYWLIEKKNLKPRNLVLILFFLLDLSFLKNAVNGASFKFPLYILIYSCFESIYSSENVATSVINMLIMCMLSGAGIAVHSSFLFQGAIILVALVISLVIKKKDKQIIYLLPSGIVLLTYACFFFNKGRLSEKLWLVSAITLFVYYFIRKIPKILHIIHKICSLTVLILIWSMSIKIIIDNTQLLGFSDFVTYFFQDANNLSSFFQSIFYFMMLVLTFWYVIKNKFNSFEAVILSIYYLYFFNPLSIYFVSKYLTDTVYFRIDEFIYKTPYFLICILASINMKKIIKYGFALLGGLTILSYFEINKIYKLNSMSLVYRMPDTFVSISKNLAEYIHNYDVDDYKVRVISTDLRFRFFSEDSELYFCGNDFRNYYDSTRSDEFSYPSFLYFMLTNAHGATNEMYDLMNRVIVDNGIAFILIDKDNAERVDNKLSSKCLVILENEDYVSYRCR